MTAARTFAAGLAVLAIGALPACTSSNTDQPQSADQPIAEQTRVTGLAKTAVNSVGCQWLAGGGILGPHFSFSWYRGSPIGRERKTEELTRTSVDDIKIEGHDGWVAVGSDPMLGDNLCEIAIQFDDDFIEWSISFDKKPFPPACDVAKELTRQSIVNAK